MSRKLQNKTEDVCWFFNHLKVFVGCHWTSDFGSFYLDIETKIQCFLENPNLRLLSGFSFFGSL